MRFLQLAGLIFEQKSKTKVTGVDFVFMTTFHAPNLLLPTQMVTTKSRELTAYIRYSRTFIMVKYREWHISVSDANYGGN